LRQPKPAAYGSTVSVVWKEETVVFVRDRGFLQDIFDISGRTNEIITPARSRILGKFASTVDDLARKWTLGKDWVTAFGTCSGRKS
jgi:hypothetical protein